MRVLGRRELNRALLARRLLLQREARPIAEVVVERVHNGAFGRRMGGADPAELAAAVRALLDGEALTARAVCFEPPVASP